MSKNFKRPEHWKYRRLGEKWRKPRGSKNPARRGKAGRPALPRIGHRRPAALRGRHPSGLDEVLVHRPEELATLDPAKVVVRIARTVGGRKRAAILAAARENGLRVIQNEGSKKAGK